MSAGRKQTRQERERAADRRVLWRILGAAGEIGQLERMGVHRDIPVTRERIHVAAVVEVSVREKDGRRFRPRSEAALGGSPNEAAEARKSRVDQHPVTDGSHQVRVDESGRDPDDVWGAIDGSSFFSTAVYTKRSPELSFATTYAPQSRTLMQVKVRAVGVR